MKFKSLVLFTILTGVVTLPAKSQRLETAPVRHDHQCDPDACGAVGPGDNRIVRIACWEV